MDPVDPWVKPATRVTVVCGPPLSGKTTYVRQNASRGDLIVDVDWLYAALTGHELYFKPDELLPFVASARDAILNRLMAPSKVDRAWVITSNPEAAHQLVARLHATRIDLTVTNEEAKIRRSKRAQLKEFKGFIDDRGGQLDILSQAE